MNGKINLHTHTLFCDGDNSPRELAETAVEKGFSVLGFSGHSYTSFDEGCCMSRQGTADYRNEINALKSEYAGRLKILCGVEQDYYSDYPADDYDFVIGSVHYLKVSDGYISVDESADIQRCAVEKYFGGDWYAFTAEYFRTVSDVIRKTGADIIGHFDLAAKFNENGVFFDESDERYLSAAYAAAETLIDAGGIFEINYGAVVHGLRSQPYPRAEIRDFIEAKGGRFIASSDCHEKEYLDFGIE